MFNYTSKPDISLDFQIICPTEELQPGQRLFLEISEAPIVLLNIAGKYYAIGDLCTHDNGPLGDGELDGEHVICPRHGAKFNIETGSVVSFPATEDIPAYPVRIRNGQIEIGIPRQL
jgi:3-phenylpropionate/trans-cinnamate dioxygenase ferredoxin component